MCPPFDLIPLEELSILPLPPAETEQGAGHEIALGNHPMRQQRIGSAPLGQPLQLLRVALLRFAQLDLRQAQGKYARVISQSLNTRPQLDCERATLFDGLICDDIFADLAQSADD